MMAENVILVLCFLVEDKLNGREREVGIQGKGEEGKRGRCKVKLR